MKKLRMILFAILLLVIGDCASVQASTESSIAIQNNKSSAFLSSSHYVSKSAVYSEKVIDLNQLWVLQNQKFQSGQQVKVVLPEGAYSGTPKTFNITVKGDKKATLKLVNGSKYAELKFLTSVSGSDVLQFIDSCSNDNFVLIPSTTCGCSNSKSQPILKSSSVSQRSSKSVQSSSTKISSHSRGISSALLSRQCSISKHLVDSSNFSSHSSHALSVSSELSMRHSTSRSMPKLSSISQRSSKSVQSSSTKISSHSRGISSALLSRQCSISKHLVDSSNSSNHSGHALSVSSELSMRHSTSRSMLKLSSISQRSSKLVQSSSVETSSQSRVRSSSLLSRQCSVSKHLVDSSNFSSHSGHVLSVSSKLNVSHRVSQTASNSLSVGRVLSKSMRSSTRSSSKNYTASTMSLPKKRSSSHGSVNKHPVYCSSRQLKKNSSDGSVNYSKIRDSNVESSAVHKHRKQASILAVRSNDSSSFHFTGITGQQTLVSLPLTSFSYSEKPRPSQSPFSAEVVNRFLLSHPRRPSNQEMRRSIGKLVVNDHSHNHKRSSHHHLHRLAIRGILPETRMDAYTWLYSLIGLIIVIISGHALFSKKDKDHRER